MIRKKKPSENFTPISNGVFRDIRLTLTDRGLLTTLLSLPESWNFSIAGLSRILSDGKSRIRSSLNHLADLGYITIVQERDPTGMFSRNLLIINETANLPQAENPLSENPSAGIRATSNRTQYKNNNTKNKNSKYKELEYEIFSPNQDQPKKGKARKKSSLHNFDQRQYAPEFYQRIEHAMQRRPSIKEISSEEL